MNFYFVFENVINFNKNICIINEKDIINIIKQEEIGVKIDIKDMNNEQLKKFFVNNVIIKIEKNNDNNQ